MCTYKQLYEAGSAGTINPALLTEVEAVVAKADVEYLLTDITQAIQQSLQGIERIATIVRAMKEFSHPGNTNKVETDLNHAIKTTVAVARNEWKYVADITFELDPELPRVPCLPGEFNQVVLNLIINAAHAIADVVSRGEKKKGTITVSTRQDGDWVEVRVRDTSIGIPEAIRTKIFDPFFTTKEVGKGTGQGLAIVYSVIVDKHQGKIAVETREGHGTTFILRLPLGVSEDSGANIESR